MTKPELVETALVPVEVHAVELGTLRANNPDQMMERAVAIAKPLKAMIDAQELYTKIGKKRHVHIEGWTALAALLNITPHEENVERSEDGSGYTATVQLRRLSDGMQVSRASAECNRTETKWEDRDDYALRSMAVTRATGKACRLAFSWIMVLGGYSPTPAEEMPSAEPTAMDLNVIPFGGQKGEPLADCSTEHLQSMLDWCRKNNTFPSQAAVMTQLLAKRAAKVEREPGDEGHGSD